VDETLPLEFGCIGQETTGPGGFAKALRTVPVVLDIAEETERRGAKGAWVIDFTNPVGIVMQALLDHGHRAIGLCNSAMGFQRRFARLLDVGPEHVALDHVGLNHLTWERAVMVDGVDRLPDLIERSGAQVADEGGMPLSPTMQRYSDGRMTRVSKSQAGSGPAARSANSSTRCPPRCSGLSSK